MTRKLPPRAVLFGRAAAEARLRYADTLFAPEAVFATMGEVVSTGGTRLVVRPDRPFDLRDTPAAVRLVELLEREGFTTKWQPIDNPESPDAAPHYHLVVTWSLAREDDGTVKS
ncbi:hypothetical protein [Methyloraptor flagellatus]|uniref:Uncharacterized protein n=1 Tax=Methyloraptor flagellatus TaxID=3162530 RepID=A0AAU7XJ52_9HYPH